MAFSVPQKKWDRGLADHLAGDTATDCFAKQGVRISTHDYEIGRENGSEDLTQCWHQGWVIYPAQHAAKAREDPHFVSTVERLEENLARGPRVVRYESADGLACRKQRKTSARSGVRILSVA